MKKQRVADAAVDSMQQQMMELGRSDTLSRAREKHDRDMSAVREKHEAKLLVLQQQLDTCSQDQEEQVSAYRHPSNSISCCALVFRDHKLCQSGVQIIKLCVCGGGGVRPFSPTVNSSFVVAQRECVRTVLMVVFSEGAGPETAGAGDPAGAQERGGAGGEGYRHQHPHSAPGGGPAAVCQTAPNRSLGVCPVHFLSNQHKRRKKYQYSVYFSNTH